MMMTDARGKLGGQVFSKNKSGSYVRTKVTPTNPRTQRQMQSRTMLGTLSALWNSLTLEQVKAWNKAVEDWARTDIFGDLKNPTGKNLFVSLNKNLLGLGYATKTLPPEKIAMVSVSGFEISVNSNNNGVIVNGLSTLDSGLYQVMATPTVATGVNYVKNKLRVVGNYSSSSDIQNSFTSDYTDLFGTAPIGEKTFIQIRQIGNNGQAGTPFMIRLGISHPE